MSTLYDPALPFPIQPEMRTSLYICLDLSLLPGSSSTRPPNHKALFHRICTIAACLRMETTSCAVLEEEGRSTGRQRGSGRITGLLHHHRHHRLSWLIRPDCLHFSLLAPGRASVSGSTWRWLLDHASDVVSLHTHNLLMRDPVRLHASWRALLP
jgi:hypothetical protein